jgi:hypothetical protein
MIQAAAAESGLLAMGPCRQQEGGENAGRINSGKLPFDNAGLTGVRKSPAASPGNSHPLSRYSESMRPMRVGAKEDVPITQTHAAQNHMQSFSNGPGGVGPRSGNTFAGGAQSGPGQRPTADAWTPQWLCAASASGRLR